MSAVGDCDMPQKNLSSGSKSSVDNAKDALSSFKLVTSNLDSIEGNFITGLETFKDFLISDLLPVAFKVWTSASSALHSAERALKILRNLESSDAFPATFSQIKLPLPIYDRSLDVDGTFGRALQISVDEMNKKVKSDLLSLSIETREKQIEIAKAILDKETFYNRYCFEIWQPAILARIEKPSSSEQGEVTELCKLALNDLRASIRNYDVLDTHLRILKEEKEAKAKANATDASMDVDAITTQDSILEQVNKAMSARLDNFSKEFCKDLLISKMPAVRNVLRTFFFEWNESLYSFARPRSSYLLDKKDWRLVERAKILSTSSQTEEQSPKSSFATDRVSQTPDSSSRTFAPGSSSIEFVFECDLPVKTSSKTSFEKRKRALEEGQSKARKKIKVLSSQTSITSSSTTVAKQRSRSYLRSRKKKLFLKLNSAFPVSDPSVESIEKFTSNPLAKEPSASQPRALEPSQSLLAIDLDLPVLFNIRNYRTWPSLFLSLDSHQQRLFVALHSSPLWVDTAMRKPKLLNPFELPFPIEIQRLLSFNLKFIVRPKIDVHTPLEEYDRLERSARTNYLFRNKKDKTGHERYIPKFHVKSLDWIPATADPMIERGLLNGRTVLQDALRKVDHSIWRPNFSISSLRALEDLMLQYNFIVKASDKNLGLTILPRDWYIDEALRQLGDKSIYLELESNDPEDIIDDLLNSRRMLISRAMSSDVLFDLIPKKAEKFMLQLDSNSVKLPEFHMLPKLHKKTIAGRPIVPSYAWVTSHVSIFIDTLLQPMLSEFPWIIKDSKDLLRKLLTLKLPEHEQLWIVTADIRSMYTNIPSEEGARVVSYLGQHFYTNEDPGPVSANFDRNIPDIGDSSQILDTFYDRDYYRSEAYYDFKANEAERYFNRYMDDSSSCSDEPDRERYESQSGRKDIYSVREFFEEFLLFVLNNSYIGFQNRIWKQISGTAMGTAMAPAYANLFVGAFERELNIPKADNVVFYGRYIDDVIAIIKGPRSNVDQFAEELNNMHESLVFDIESSSVGLPFLDAFVSLVSDRSSLGQREISTRLYQKPLNSYQYIPWSSFHPVDVKLAFVKGELIRYIRLSSSKDDYIKSMGLFYTRLRARGYPPRWLRVAFSQVQYDTFRARSLRVSLQSTEPTSVPLFFVTKYNPVWDQVDASVVLRSVTQDWDPATRAVVTRNPEGRIMRSRSRARNLGDVLNTLNKKVLARNQK